MPREQSPERRESQRRLAEEITCLAHGAAGLAKAQRATEILFGAEVQDLSDAELGEIFADVPARELPARRFGRRGSERYRAGSRRTSC